MLTNWYTLRALIGEWRPLLTGRVLVDAYSQNKGTLVLVFEGSEPGSEPGSGSEGSDDAPAAQSLTISLQSPHRHLFLDGGSSRARRNVADVFPDALGRRVATVDVADRDRLVYIGLDDASRVIIVPFGPQANVYWCPRGRAVETFLARRIAPNTIRLEQAGADTDADADADTGAGSGHAGMASSEAGLLPPAPRPAPCFEPPEEDIPLSVKALATRLPLFPKPLIREVMARCGAASTGEGRTDSADAWARAAAVVQQIEAELCMARCAWMYFDGAWPEVLSLVRLTHLMATAPPDALPQGAALLQEEAGEDISEAVRRVARRRMGLARFRNRYQPLERALVASAGHAERSLQRMDEELKKPSRADEWENVGHTLMAQIHLVPPGADQVELPDIMTGEGTLTIVLKPELGAVGNAEWYYDRARRARESRAHATSRLDAARQALATGEELLCALRAAGSMKELDAFERAHAGRLSRLRGQGRAEEARPYRRYVLADGYEVWVGRNARENDLLTQRDSRPYDLWLHARGVPGSHVVLRLKGRSVTPPASVVETAAGIAAWWSKARTSHLAPVIVTERKYVRKPRGATAGAVLIDREDVLMVEPALFTQRQQRET